MEENKLCQSTDMGNTLKENQNRNITEEEEKEKGNRPCQITNREENKLWKSTDMDSSLKEDQNRNTTEEEEEKNRPCPKTNMEAYKPRQSTDTASSLMDKENRDSTNDDTEEGNIPVNWQGLKKNASEDDIPFLKEFPAHREEIEKCIHCLWERADSIDKTHKDCTIANITANCASASSGILTILGLALAPVTAGGSLILTITGASVGAAAAATGISASLSEHIITSKKSKKSQRLIDKCEESLSQCRKSLATFLGLEVDFNYRLPPNKKDIQEICQHVTTRCNIAGSIPGMAKTVVNITKNVKALKFAQANPILKVLAKQATAAGGASRASINGVKQVEEAFKGTALAMTKGARVLGAVGAGVFLVYNAYRIVQDAIHLVKGSKAAKADEIRGQAQKLEEALQNLIKVYKHLTGTE